MQNVQQPTARSSHTATADQASLRALLAQTSAPRRKFVRDRPVAVFPLTAASLNDVPHEILSHMGTFEHDAREGWVGGAIVLQSAGGVADFYPIPADVYRDHYDAGEFSEFMAKNDVAHSQLGEHLGMHPESVPGVTAALKVVPTEMFRVSDLGFYVHWGLDIVAPWGGTQRKPAGRDAYLVNKGGKIYMINTSTEGLPIAHVEHE